MKRKFCPLRYLRIWNVFQKLGDFKESHFQVFEFGEKRFDIQPEWISTLSKYFSSMCSAGNYDARRFINYFGKVITFSTFSIDFAPFLEFPQQSHECQVALQPQSPLVLWELKVPLKNFKFAWVTEKEALKWIPIKVPFFFLNPDISMVALECQSSLGILFSV